MTAVLCMDEVLNHNRIRIYMRSSQWSSTHNRPQVSITPELITAVLIQGVYSGRVHSQGKVVSNLRLTARLLQGGHLLEENPQHPLATGVAASAQLSPASLAGSPSSDA